MNDRLPPVIRTGEGLRDALFDEMDRFRDGRGDRRRAAAICELARQIIKSAWLEVELSKRIADQTISVVPTMKLGHIENSHVDG